MGGSKTVNAQQYISKRDPSRDIAIAMMMQQAQAQQMATQAEMLKQYTGFTPQIQTYDPLATSKRAAELGVQNIQRQREMEKLASPEAAALRLSQSQELERLTDPQTRENYMREYMRTQGIPEQYATGLGDSTIGRAAMYDRALQARKAFEDSLALQRQAYLSQTQAPVGGISPETSIQAQQAVQAQNLAAQEAYKQAMFGNIAAYGQSAANMANQQFANFGGLQQSQQQSQQRYQQAMLENQAQNLASQREMTSAWIKAGGNVASSAIGAAAGKFGGGGGGGGYESLSAMQQATIPGTTGSYVSGMGYVPKATLA